MDNGRQVAFLIAIFGSRQKANAFALLHRKAFGKIAKIYRLHSAIIKKHSLYISKIIDKIS